MPSKGRHRSLDEIHRRNLPDKIVGHADGNAGASFVDRNQRGDTAAEALLHAVDFAAQALGIEAFDDLAEEGIAANLLGAGFI